MKALIPVLCASAALTLSACATMQQLIGHKEDLLSASGFRVEPANNPQRQAELSKLPPNKFVMRAKGNHVVYLYADPVVCNCLYVGDQENYDKYRNKEFQQHIANQQQLAAQMYQGSWDWDAWNWEPWGLGPRFYWW